MYYVYVIKKSHTLYIGYTNDLQRRVKEHQLKEKSELLYYEAYQSKHKATQREKKLKHYGSAWRALRERLIA